MLRLHIAGLDSGPTGVRVHPGDEVTAPENGLTGGNRAGAARRALLERCWLPGEESNLH